MDLWRRIPIGDKPPDSVNVVVEVISGSRDKYEYNADWEAFVLDRVLHSSVVFPVEYGFIPQTWFDDNDPLDIMVLTYEPTEVGCIIKVRPIGLLIMEDEKGVDPKILSVPIRDPRFDGFREITDVHPTDCERSKNSLKFTKGWNPVNGSNSKLVKTLKKLEKSSNIQSICIKRTTLQNRRGEKNKPNFDSKLRGDVIE